MGVNATRHPAFAQVRRRSRGQVLTTRSAGTPSRVARSPPYCEEVELAGRVGVGVDGEQAAGLERQDEAARRAGRSAPGRELISTATSCSAQAANTAAGVELALRPGAAAAGHQPAGAVAEHVGLRVADGGQHPPGHRGGVHRSLECTEATTTSSRPSSSSVWSRPPSSRMSTSMPVSSRNPSPRWRVDRVDDLELLGEPVRGEPVGDGQPRRVVGEHQVLVAELDGGHAISSIGEPPSDQSEWRCRSPRSARPSSCAAVDERPGGALDLGEVVRLPAGDAVGDDRPRSWRRCRAARAACPPRRGPDLGGVEWPAARPRPRPGRP